MIQLSSPLRTKNVRTLVDRVRDRLSSLGCDRVWARSASSHIVLGCQSEAAFARLSPLGGGAYGLAFAAKVGEVINSASPSSESDWEPILLVDTLSDVVEHALVAIDALEMRAEATT